MPYVACRIAAAAILALAAVGCQQATPIVAGEPAAVPETPASYGLTAREPNPVSAALARRERDVLLSIAPRRQAPGHPPEGWCGETAIQEAMLHHGIFYPQRMINEAGHPRHPDLYSDEVPVALRNLGMHIRMWPDGNRQPDLDGFLRWVRSNLDASTPVLCGVKINPTEHPNWSLDHFVLAVGYGEDSIQFNTTWGTRVARTEKQLRSTREKGFALANAFDAYYGIAVVGPAGRDAADATVRLRVQQEDKDRMSLTVGCEHLQPGAGYAIYRLNSQDEKDAAPIHRFTAAGESAVFSDVVARSGPAIYRCRKIADAPHSSPAASSSRR